MLRKPRGIFEFRKCTEIYGMIGAIRNPRCRACDMIGTRCDCDRLRARGLVGECSETQSRSNEKIIYLPGYIRFQNAQMHPKLAYRVDSVRIHRGKASGRCIGAARRGDAFTNMHQRVRVAERLSHAKSLRDIEYFPRRIYLSQCVRMQYPIAINAVVSNAQSLISQNIRNAL